MPTWTPFPHDPTTYTYTLPALKKHWARLHAGDAEPWPSDKAVQAAWALYHAGQFRQAHEAGLKAGGGGITVANRAQAIHAHYLAKDDATKLAMLQAVVTRAEKQAATEPGNPNAHYWLANALGRYSQCIGVARALAEGLPGRVKSELEATIRLQPRHADAHIALGAFHAEVINKVGRLLGKLQGADAATALRCFERALALNPGSAIGLMEYANGLVMLEGDKRLKEAERRYAEAAACVPMDAMERLDVEAAKAEIAA